MTVLDHPQCHCGAREYRIVRTGRWQRGPQPAGIPFAVAECRECGLARTLPVPDSSLYERAESAWSGVGERVDRWSARIVEQLERRGARGRLLDVGCNIGNLVEAAARRGFRAEGIDLDPVAIAKGARLGRPVSTTPLDEVKGPYDVVVMNHVLEHVPDLREFMGHVDRVLAPDGLLMIRVPYHRGVVPRLMKDRWFAWAPDEHIWHFVPKTLERVVCESADLRPASLATRGTIEPRSYGLKGFAKKVIARSASRLGSGDQIVAIFVR